MLGSEFASVALGLASAASWGAGDFCGGLATKRASVYAVVITSQAAGVALLFGPALMFGETIPPLSDLMWGAGAGIAGAVGLLALYRGLASGQMGLVAPVSAVVAAALPVVVAAFLQGLPGSLKLAGFGAALGGIWFLSRPTSQTATPFRSNDLGLPLLAGLGFGLFFVLIDQGNDRATFWPIVAARFASLTLLTVIAWTNRQPIAPEHSQLWLVALAGVLDAGGNAFFSLAVQAGRLDVASVLSSLYPASAVALAWWLLKERLTRVQWASVGAALAAIVLIAV
jgi:drug/metabolite transporter (DMT)-like permease